MTPSPIINSIVFLCHINFLGVVATFILLYRCAYAHYNSPLLNNTKWSKFEKE